MDRWLFTFFLGAILSLFLPIVPDVSQLFISLSLALLFSFIKCLRNYSGLFFGCSWLLIAGISYENIWLLNKLNIQDFVGKTIVIKGTINNIPSQQKNATRFNFIIDEFNGKKLPEKIKIRLRWDDKTQFFRTNSSPLSLQQGQQWKLHVRLKPAHGFANVGGFSYQTWLRQKSIHATGYVKKSKQNTILDVSTRYRQKLYLELDKLLSVAHSNRDVSHFIYPLTFGERSHISTKQWQVLQATGTQHLMAISGLHLGLIASGGYFIVLWLIRLLPLRFMLPTQVNTWLLLKNSRLLAFVFSGGIAVFYAYLAGFSLPTIRAMVMLLLFIAAKILAVKLSVVRWLLLSIVTIILLNPFSIFSASFWLSIYAVTLILLIIWRCRKLFNNCGESRFSKVQAWLSSLLIVQLGLSLFMLPVAALLNYELPLSAFMANIIAVPWMSFTAIPLCLLSVVVMPFSETLANFFLELSLLSLELIWEWLSYLASKSELLVKVSHDQLMMILAFMGLLFISVFFTPRKIVIVVMLTTLLLGLMTNTLYQQKNNEWQVNVLDVGHGLAVIIERNGHAVLYDTGASYPSGFNLAQSVISPYLQYKGISLLDHLIISHSDNDHAGGLQYFSEQVSINQLKIGEINTNIKAVDAYSFAVKNSCQQGNEFIWQGLTFSVLWPVLPKGEENDDSCMVKISDGKNSILLTGDISHKVESILIDNNEIVQQLSADIIIAPHHGSKTSSSLAFIHAVSPKAVIFSTGFLNRWRMPHTSVLERYQLFNVTQYSTADQGMIHIKISDKRLEIQSYREHIKPYWFAN
jgi:competence protein ComEC